MRTKSRNGDLNAATVSIGITLQFDSHVLKQHMIIVAESVLCSLHSLSKGINGAVIYFQRSLHCLLEIPLQSTVLGLNGYPVGADKNQQNG